VATALALAPGTADPALRAKALHWLAGLAFAQGDFRAAREPAGASVALFGEAASPHDLGFAQIILGLVEFGSGDHSSARATLGTAQSTLRGAGDERWGVAFALYCLGDVTLALGDAPAARAAYEESLAFFDELGDRWGRAVLLHALGHEAEARGDLAAAQSLYTASEALFREMGDRWDLARVIAARQSVALREGDSARARALCAESLTLSRDLGNTHGMLKSLEVLAEIEAAEGQPARAARLLGAVDAASTAIGRPVAQPAIASVRSHLDDAAFTAAWSDGHALSLDQALSEAVSQVAPAAG
jgi:tetratricopeptide (TPR) repeat protein